MLLHQQLPRHTQKWNIQSSLIRLHRRELLQSQNAGSVCLDAACFLALITDTVYKITKSILKSTKVKEQGEIINQRREEKIKNQKTNKNKRSN